MKKVILLISLIFLSCHYQKDKLKVFNNSTKEIHCLPMLYELDRRCYTALSVAGDIDQGDQYSPSLRRFISDYMKQKEFDGFLYLVFFESKNDDYALSDGVKNISEKRFNVQKYSLKELDSLNWEIEYKGK